MKAGGTVLKRGMIGVCSLLLVFLLFTGCTSWKDSVQISDVKQKSLYSLDVSGTATNLTSRTLKNVKVNFKFTTLAGETFTKTADVGNLQPNMPRRFVCPVSASERYWHYEVESVIYS